jgi:hypothetical protein
MRRRRPSTQEERGRDQRDADKDDQPCDALAPSVVELFARDFGRRPGPLSLMKVQSKILSGPQQNPSLVRLFIESLMVKKDR